MPLSRYPNGRACPLPPDRGRPLLAVAGGGDASTIAYLKPWLQRYGDAQQCSAAVETLEVTPNSQCQRRRHCGPQQLGRVEMCFVGKLAHCWGGTSCCNPECTTTHHPDDLQLTPYMMAWLMASVAHLGRPAVSEANTFLSRLGRHVLASEPALSHAGRAGGALGEAAVSGWLRMAALAALASLVRPAVYAFKRWTTDARLHWLLPLLQQLAATAGTATAGAFLFFWFYLRAQLLADPRLDSCPHEAPRTVFRYYYHIEEVLGPAARGAAAGALAACIAGWYLRGWHGRWRLWLGRVAVLCVAVAALRVGWQLAAGAAVGGRYAQCANTAEQLAAAASAGRAQTAASPSSPRQGALPAPIDMPVVVLARQPSCINALVLARLLKRLAPAQKVYVVVDEAMCDSFTFIHPTRVVCVPEAKAAGISREALAHYFQHRRQVDPHQVYKGRTLTGWYLQQIAKLATYRFLPRVPGQEYVLLWDGDMLMSDQYEPLGHVSRLPRLHVGGLFIDAYAHAFYRATGLPFLFTSRWESLVTHHAVLPVRLVDQFLAELGLADVTSAGAVEVTPGSVTAFLDLIATEDLVKGFSEYGSWASWVLQRYPEQVELVLERTWSRQLPAELLTAITRDQGCCPAPEHSEALWRFLETTRLEYVGFEAGHLPQCQPSAEGRGV